MRIISGTYKGRQLHAPANLPVRPTTDYARTALFNILNSRIDFDEVSFIDLFSGTGAISIEMASRGCRDITSVDNNRNCTRFLEQTIADWKIPGIRPFKEDVFKFLEHTSLKADLIFADPPYELPQLKMLPALVEKKQLVRPGGLFILEHGDRTGFEEEPRFEEHRRYGNVNFSIFQY